MSQGSQSQTNSAPSFEFSHSDDPYNRRPAGNGETARRRTLDDMRKLSEEIKSLRIVEAAPSRRLR